MDSNKSNEGLSNVKTIKLRKVSFGPLPFRKLRSIEIGIGSRLTLIAGRNGVGKSTLLALIAGGSGLTRNKLVDHNTYFGSLPNPSAEDILKLSYARDFVRQRTLKPYVLLNYNFGNSEFVKKGNVSGNVKRLRVVPRNEPKKEIVIDDLTIQTDGKVPIATVYLGMMRVLPIGEADNESIEHNSIQMHPDDYGIYWDFTNKIISTGCSKANGGTTSQIVKGTKKRSVYPEYNGYDSTNVSLGQDSLSAIATALASFSKLRRTLGNDYRGGILVIDELDAGFHPHAQIELLRELKSKARKLGIQVVATTHSLIMLEHLHQDIYSGKKTGEPLDQIIYLKGGIPIEVMDSTDFSAIYADMHLMLRPSAEVPTVKIYVEDEEAALFLNAILTDSRRSEIESKINCKLDVVPVRVGCSNLIGLIKADEHFKSVVIVLDGDTENVNSGGNPNVARLPVDSRNTKKQSPEVIIKAMCEKMCEDAVAYPYMRQMWKPLGVDTEYVDRYIIKLQQGENEPKKSVETDREVAKNWFNTRLKSIQDLKLIEGWVADNAEGVEKFLRDLELATTAALVHIERSSAGLANFAKTT